MIAEKAKNRKVIDISEIIQRSFNFASRCKFHFLAPTLVENSLQLSPYFGFTPHDLKFNPLKQNSKTGEGVGTSDTVTYSYDDLNRMLSATATSVAAGQSTYTHTYAYNAIGDITSGPVGSYVYGGSGGSLYANPHAATTINSVANTYDKDGNVLTDGTLTNTWNYKDQLATSTNGTFTRTYKYDEGGNRVSSSDGTTTTVYPNKFYNYDGTKKTKSIYAGDQLVATVETVGATVTPRYVHVDHLNSTNVVTDASGSQVELLDYFPYGSQRISSGSYTGQRQYVGQVYDSDSALNYLQARYFQSATGRFISQDPVFLALGDKKKTEEITKIQLEEILRDPQSLNSYSYANDNPMVKSDPDGKFAPAIGVLAIPGVGEIAAVGGLAIIGGAAIYYGTQAILHSNGWGDRYGGQVPMLDPAKFGFGQPPMGPEDMNWSNMNPKSPKTWIAAGLITAYVIAEGKEAINTTKEWIKNVFKGDKQDSNNDTSVQIQQNNTQQTKQQTNPASTKKDGNKNR